MPVSQFMDRTKGNTAKSQGGFIGYLVKPLFEPWIAWVDNDELYKTCFQSMLENESQWKALADATPSAASTPEVQAFRSEFFLDNFLLRQSLETVKFRTQSLVAGKARSR